MNGIIGTIGGVLSPKYATNEAQCMNQALHIKDCALSVQWNTLAKFENDKVLYEDANYAVLLDGVILNKAELQKGVSWAATLIAMYQACGKTWFSALRGSFQGLFLDKQEQKLYLFVDQIGDKPLFYSSSGKALFFASEQIALAHLLRDNHCPVSIHEGAAYCMLTYGYLFEDISYVVGVHRLAAGHFLEYDIQSASCEDKEYHRFAYSDLKEKSEDDIIERIHTLFNHAVSLQLNKNAEYGYDDFSALSGGMDSRLTTCAVSRAKGKDCFTTFTYAPIGQQDQKIAFQVAQRLPNTRNIYYATHCGDLLLDIDRSVRTNDGLYAYYGTAVLLDMFDRIDKDNIGIIHSGQIGDAVIGSINHSSRMESMPYSSLNCITKRYRTKLQESGIDIEAIGNKYDSRELYTLYSRALGVILGANKAFRSFADTFSPFYDVDFWEYCLSIPQELRRGHYLYDKYFMRYYGDFADISHNGNRLIGKRAYNTCTELFWKILHRTQKMLHIIPKSKSVTPIAQWDSIASIRSQMDAYYSDTLARVEISDALKEDIAYQYTHGTALERNIALTLLSVIKQIQEDND